MTGTATLDRLLGPVPSGGTATAARTWLAAHGLPAPGDEAWLYTDVGKVLAALELGAPAAPGHVSRSVVDELAGSFGGPRLVFVNGAYLDDVSDTAGSPSALLLGGGGPGGRADAREPADGFHALNLAAGGDTAFVRAEPGTRSADPVHVVHLTVPGRGPTVSNPRTVIELGTGSELDVIETYCGLPGPSLTNASTTIEIGPGSRLRHHRMQAEPSDALHIGHTGAELTTEARRGSTSIVLGADLARHAIEARLAGRGASADLDGLYLPAGRQRHDTTVTFDHAAPGCTSTQRFRGVVDDHGRGSFTGQVVVRPGTVATDARQSNRNLLLGPAAQADTRPWLEILADDVRCAHGATVGRLDDDALFYLRSRGIPVGEARAMLVQAFVGEITSGTSPIDGADADALGLEIPTEETGSGGSGPFDLQHVTEALQGVYDPEIPVSIVELGLVYRCDEVHLADGRRRIEIDMSMTAPGCGMGDVLRVDAMRAVEAVPGVDEVEVELVWDPPWTVHRMSEAARLQLGLL